MHVKNAAVVQRLVPMLAMHMMTVRFRSVAPIKIIKDYLGSPFIFIGASDLDICAETFDGKMVQIFKNGTWA